MNIQPFIKCLHPVRQFNKYTNEYVITNCGKCKACLLHKASTMSLRCQLESLSHKYCMFVTLTYDNDSVPLATAIPYFKDIEKGSQKWSSALPDKKEERVMLIDCSLRESVNNEQCDVVLSDVAMSHDRLESLLKKCNLNGKIPYLYHKDLQDFLKRFRKSLAKNMRKYYENRADYYSELFGKSKTDIHRSNTFQKWLNYAKKEVEKIRYYGVGELGPVHFRPHFHLLFWFEEQETLSYFAQSLSESWQFGRIDWSLSRGNTSSYVASYLNSSVSLPKIHKSKEIRPTASHSIGLGEQLFQSQYEEIFQTPTKDIVQRCVPLNGTNTDVRMWRTLKAKNFPLCSRYNQKSRLERLFSYSTYEKIRRWSGETRPFIQARIVTDYLSLHKFDDYTDLPQYVIDVFEYFRITLEFPKLIECFEYEKVFRVIYRELYISERFYNMCKVYTSDEVLDKIEQFYSDLDYQNLVQQYQWQAEVLEKELMSEHCVMMNYNNQLSYYSCDPREGYKYIKEWFLLQPLLMQYATNVNDRFNHSIKHKTLNDKNKFFIN